MGKRNQFLALFAGLLFVSVGLSAQNQPAKKITYPMPQKVQTVFENKCYGCHNNEARSEKARTGLNFDTLDQLDKVQLVSRLSEVKKEVSEGEMPPKKMVEKHPEAALTAAESKALIAWVKTESAKQLKNKRN